MNAIVLAGGLSTRMGTDKTLLLFEGLPLVLRAVQRISSCAEEVLLVVADPGKYAGFGARVVVDLVPRRGPLGGLLSGLSASRAELNAVVAGDMPFFSPELMLQLAAHAEGFDAVVPLHMGRWEPLHAVYSRNCLVAARALLAESEKAGLADLLRRVRTLPVAVEDLDPARDWETVFLNVNTPQDLEAARRLAGGGR